MPTVDVYFRYGDEKERDDIVGLLDMYANQRGMTVRNRFYDRKDSDAICFEMLLKAAEDGAVECLLLPDVGALGDERLMIEQNYYSMLSRGVELAFVMCDTVASFCQNCLNTVKSYNTKGIDWSVRLGKIPKVKAHKATRSSLPYGYRIVDGVVQEEETESRLVAAAFDMYAHGMSASDIAAKLTALSPDGKRFTRTGILSMIDNRRYCGIDKNVHGAIPALVVNAVWFAARERREKNKIPKPYAHEFLLKNVKMSARVRRAGETQFTRIAGCFGFEDGQTKPMYVIRSGKGSQCISAVKFETDVLNRVTEWATANADVYVDAIAEYAAGAAALTEARIVECREELEALRQRTCGSEMWTATELYDGLTGFDRIKYKYGTIKSLMHRAEIDHELCLQSREDIEAFFARLKNIEKLGTPEKEFLLNNIIKSISIMLHAGKAVLRFNDGTKTDIPVTLNRPNGRIINL